MPCLPNLRRVVICCRRADVRLGAQSSHSGPVGSSSKADVGHAACLGRCGQVLSLWLRQTKILRFRAVAAARLPLLLVSLGWNVFRIV